MSELIVLAIAVVVAIVMATRIGRLEKAIFALSERLTRVEHPELRVSASPETAVAAPPAAPATATPPPAVAAAPPPAPTPEPPAAPEAPGVPEVPAPPTPAIPVAPPPGDVPMPTPAPSPERTRKGFEESFGTRWVVWIGGLALALGGVFLVQYSIEQGFFGPGIRIFLAAVLAALLIAAGEWTRRNDNRTGFAGLPAAHVPGMLTAVGTLVAFADAYAAYALYGFLDPAAAFILLAAIALATLAASLVHGPALAGIGMVGAFIVPLLISSSTPNYWTLTVYIAVVTAAAFALASARRWQWLAVAAAVLSAVWIVPGIADLDAVAPHAVMALSGLALAAIFIVAGLVFGPEAKAGFVDGVSSLAVAVYLLAATHLLLAVGHDDTALAAFAVAVAATLLIAWRAESAAGAVPVAGALLVFVMAHWALGPRGLDFLLAGNPLIGQPLAFTEPHVLAAVGLSIALALGGYFAQGRHDRAPVPLIWAAAGAIVPVAMLLVFYYRLNLQYYRISDPHPSYGFAALALVMAILATAATERVSRLRDRAGADIAAAIFATAGVVLLSLALAFALEEGWLTIGFALMVPGIAWIQRMRPLPVLRWLAGAIAILVVARTGWDATFAWDIGTTPIFNWLLVAYGIPAVAFAVAGTIFRSTADDRPARIVDSAAAVLGSLLIVHEIHHFAHRGNDYGRVSDFIELALQTSAMVLLAMAFERIRASTRSPVHAAAAAIVAFIGLLGLLSLAGPMNPWVNPVPVGGGPLNLLVLGYLLPAILVVALAWLVRGVRPAWYGAIAAVAAVVMVLLYLSLSVTHAYHGAILAFPNVGDAEQYTYSAVWLVFGVALLVVGIAIRSQPVRLASAAVTLATVAKVFLIDLGDLTGVLRALSFLGLGVVLIAIGWLYQRLLFPQRKTAAAEPQANP